MAILLHFGMQKTASTSLQRSFHRKGRWEDCLYLACGGTQSNLLVEIRSRSGLDAFRAEIARAFLEPISRSDAARIIISSENFPFLDRDGVLALTEALLGTGHDLSMMGYVRRPASFMESILQERLKKRPLRAPDMPRLYPAYRRKFVPLQAAQRRFGVPVTYWRFDPGALEGGCIVRDFCARTGIPFDPADVVTENVGLSLPAIRLLYRFRAAGGTEPHGAPGNRRLVARLGTLAGPKLRLHSTFTAPILAANRADIAWMERKLGCDLDEDLAARDAAAIRGLEDLARPDPAAFAWLWQETGGGTAPADPEPQALVGRMQQLSAP